MHFDTNIAVRSHGVIKPFVSPPVSLWRTYLFISSGQYSVCTVLLYSYLYPSRSTFAHQDLKPIKIYLCPSGSTSAQDLLPLIKNLLLHPRIVSAPQNLFLFISIYFYSLRAVLVHQNLLQLLKICFCSPKSTSAPQDLFLFVKIYFYPSRSVSVSQDLLLLLKIRCVHQDLHLPRNSRVTVGALGCAG